MKKEEKRGDSGQSGVDFWHATSTAECAIQCVENKCSFWSFLGMECILYRVYRHFPNKKELDMLTYFMNISAQLMFKVFSKNSSFNPISC